MLTWEGANKQDRQNNYEKLAVQFKYFANILKFVITSQNFP